MDPDEGLGPLHTPREESDQRVTCDCGRGFFTNISLENSLKDAGTQRPTAVIRAWEVDLKRVYEIDMYLGLKGLEPNAAYKHLRRQHTV